MATAAELELKAVVHQFHYSVAPGDAITQQMLLIRNVLKKAGIEGEIFAVENRFPERPIRRYSPEAMGDGSLLLLHHSQGNPSLEELLRLPVPCALMYHNITPEEFYRHDPYIAHLSHLGREQLLLLRRRVVATYAASAYNAFELKTLGFGECPVLPLVDLSERRPSRAKEKKNGPILFVGRIAPHKNQALQIKSYYYLRRIWKDAPELVLVGGGDPFYLRYLKLLTKGLQLDGNVRFAGKISAEALAELYRDARAFLCTSLHEGFCVPLVEAMCAGVPVFALPLTGAKGTLGGAGLQLLSRKPHRIAEALFVTLNRPEAVKAILLGQEQRLKQLAREQTPGRVTELVESALAQRIPAIQAIPSKSHHEPRA